MPLFSQARLTLSAPPSFVSAFIAVVGNAVLCMALLGNTLVYAQESSGESDILIPGTAVEGRMASGDQLARFVVQAGAGSILTLDFLFPDNDGDANWMAQIIAPTGERKLAEFYFDSGAEVQLRSLSVNEDGAHQIVIHRLDDGEQAAQYSLNARLSSEAAVGRYDGIWQIGEEGFAYIEQDAEKLLVLILGNGPTLGYRWEAQSGSIEGASAITDTVMGYVQLRLRFDFTSLTEGSVTLLRCNVLDVNYPCLFPQGTNIPLRKTDQF